MSSTQPDMISQLRLFKKTMALFEQKAKYYLNANEDEVPEVLNFTPVKLVNGDQICKLLFLFYLTKENSI